MNNETQADRYRVGRSMFPGLIGATVRDKRVLVAVTLISIAYAFASSWRAGSQVIECKQDKQQGFVVVLDEHGNRAATPVYGAADWRFDDGMVVYQLQRILRCVRGLDSSPKIAGECWDEVSPYFFGAAAAPFEKFERMRFPNADAVLKATSQEEIKLDFGPYSKPAKNRYFLPWAEVHYPRGSTAATTERWSGTFEVTLVPVEQESKSLGMRIEHYDWQCELGTACKGIK